VFWRGRVVADDDNNTPRCCILAAIIHHTHTHTSSPDSDDDERSIFFRHSESFESNIYNMSLYSNRTELRRCSCRVAANQLDVPGCQKKIIITYNNIITCSSSRCHTTDDDVADAIYYIGIMENGLWRAHS